MRRVILIVLSLISIISTAQNIQILYDSGNGRNHITTTLEMFRPDDWGDTFYFVDMDYNQGKYRYPGLAYMEFARNLRFWKEPISLHLEYNGGLMASDDGAFIPIENAFLTGVDFGWKNSSFTKFFNLQLLYKNIVGKHNNSFQITGVWNLNYFDSKLSLSGFADFWREDNLNFTNAKGEELAKPTITKFVFMSEPQFWYNCTEHLSLGGELEFAFNFGAVEGFKISPAMGIKWNF